MYNTEFTQTLNFNSHAHVERDVFSLYSLLFSHYFNSHAHVERDYSGFATGTNYQDFNSHAHVERDSAKTESDMTDSIFQLTRSRGA